jgi:outer membrane protein assembly factor BamB
MKTQRVAVVLGLVLGAAIAAGSQSNASFDWPQWRGPDRSGISKETGLMKSWPSGGPRRVWLASGLGSGYGSISVRGDRVYVQGMKGRDSTVSSLDRTTGRAVWSTVIGRGRGNDRGPGPRGTPTVDGDRAYVLTENGDLACLKAADGSVLWRRNILTDFGGRNIPWLISESPLVDGDRVIVTPGGQGAGMVALDKMTGRTLWSSRELSDDAGYASVVAADVGGVRTLMTLTDSAGVGVRASDGKLMWRYQRAANRTANAATPVFFDNKVFYTSNYGTGGALLALTAANGAVQTKEVYFTRDMQNHHGGVVLVNGHLYGFNNAILTCMEFATGTVKWRNRSVGKGAVSYADGQLYILGENNIVGLVDASPDAYREKGRFEIADQGLPSWAHPVVSNGRLYIRNQGTLASHDIRAR